MRGEEGEVEAEGAGRGGWRKGSARTASGVREQVEGRLVVTGHAGVHVSTKDRRAGINRAVLPRGGPWHRTVSNGETAGCRQHVACLMVPLWTSIH